MSTEKPCVGCGYCCITATCSIGLFLFGKNGQCPALRWNGSRYICDLVDIYKNALAIGKGCCAPQNTWREKVSKKKEVYHQREIHLSLFTSSPSICCEHIKDISFASSDFTRDGLINNINAGLE
jgi:hypothetical protein